MNTKSKRATKLTPELKKNVVSLITEEGYTRQAAAEHLGISLSSVTRCANGHKRNEIKPEDKSEYLNPSEHNELERLRKENSELQKERLTLKKAIVLFANDCE